MAKKGKYTSAPPIDFDKVPWDTSTTEQRRKRTFRLTERGDVDAQTGKVINPNGVRGITYAGPLQTMRARGLLEDRHLDAAEEYERLCRACRGSPVQRSCLDDSPIGYEEPDVDPRDYRSLKSVLRALTVFQRAELDRVCWEGHETTERRHALILGGLTVVADVLGY